MSLVRSSSGALAIAASVILAACGQVADGGPGCRKDSECASGSACVVGACVPRIKGTTQTWALEMVPRTESQWAPTENPAVTFTSEPAQLRVETKTVIKGEIGEIDSSLTAASLRALVSIRSAIGKGERQFEAEASRLPADKTKVVFSLSVPESALGQAAKLTFFPSSPLDQTVPVWTVELEALGPTVILAVPKTNQVSFVEGVLQDEQEQAVVGYTARALIGTRLVSTIAKTDSQGRFKLRIPTAAVNAIDLDMVRIELAPSDSMKVGPRLETPLTATKLNLGILRLPPHPTAQLLDIPVMSQGPSQKRLPGVTLRFSTEIPKAVGGRAIFEREFQTDKDGVAHVSLLPGTAGATRDYAVIVVPPANSEFAARCFPSYSVATVPPGQARFGTSIELGNKLEVAGQVLDSTGAPQPGVIMTAIRQAGTGTEECIAEHLTPQATVTTGTDGAYRLSLDPGRYRIEYEPPMGSASTLFVERDFMVDESMLQRNVTLPGGVVATGFVRDDGGTGVMGVELRLFGQPFEGRAPELRARARTAADGRFMIVLPQNP